MLTPGNEYDAIFSYTGRTSPYECSSALRDIDDVITVKQVEVSVSGVYIQDGQIFVKLTVKKSISAEKLGTLMEAVLDRYIWKVKTIRVGPEQIVKPAFPWTAIVGIGVLGLVAIKLGILAPARPATRVEVVGARRAPRETTPTPGVVTEAAAALKSLKLSKPTTRAKAAYKPGMGTQEVIKAALKRVST